MLLAVVLALGILDAAYLTVIHFLPSALICPSVGQIINCEDVLTSSFSAVFGVPLAVLGLGWFVASLLMLMFGHDKIIKNIWMIVGLGGVMYSITAQTAIGKICIYCVTLDILIALSAGMFIYFKFGKK
jgi:uncharacterized membrane protein